VATNSDSEVTTFAYDAVGNRSRMTRANGVQCDAIWALYFMQARYYKANIGRFISMDPVRGMLEEPGSLHRYLYVANSSANRVDPWGRDWEGAVIGTCILTVIYECGKYYFEWRCHKAAEHALDRGRCDNPGWWAECILHCPLGGHERCEICCDTWRTNHPQVAQRWGKHCEQMCEKKRVLWLYRG